MARWRRAKHRKYCITPFCHTARSYEDQKSDLDKYPFAQSPT